ncbi:uncharacterized protein LOC132204683 [Neocloeon triangulifer]|uniref:uncharacterized protein LOC132204683 n=1 Tax=Neocloeon triangulifer TaxID=2078957 RepID=UPI00286F7457|nr:uncharacterized protein LOC132204683 [Neocloeon triangulifer]
MWSRTVLCGCGGQPPEMVTLNVYPQDCCMHFSIYCRHEQVALIGGFPTADVLANCAFSSTPALDSNWLALVSALGLEFCRLSDNWALVFESVKATSIFFFLGVGGFVCYKLYHYYWPKNPPDSPKLNKRNIFSATGHKLKNLYQSRRKLLGNGEDASYGSIQTNYFGPSTSCDDSDYADRSNSVSLSQSEDESFYSEPHIQERRAMYKRSRSGGFRGIWGGRKGSQTHTREVANKGWLLSRIKGSMSQFSKPTVQKKGASWPVTPCKGEDNQQPNLKKARSYWNCSERMAPDGAESSGLDVGYSYYQSMPRDFTVDSFSCNFEKHCQPRFPREGSFDSTCSEYSIEWSVKETEDSATVACLEKLQQEIDQLKNNCLMMDEDFETIKCNRNVPGMSSLMTEAPHQEFERRACFTGLYSLTCINKSISSELSDMALINFSQGSEQVKQLESPMMATPMHFPRGYLPSQEQHVSLGSAFSEEDELMANLEWDNEDLDQPLFDEQTEAPEILSCVDTLEMDLEAELSNQQDIGIISSDNNDNITENLLLATSESKKPELKLLNLQPPNLLQWSSEESGFMEWDTASETQSHRTPSETSLMSRGWLSSAKTSEQVTPESEAFLTPTSELPTPSDANPPMQMNICEKEQILQYALREWHGNTPTAQRMLKGYSEVPGVLGTQYIRRIRGDNYCALRAALFQCLVMDLPVPSGDATFTALTKAINHGSPWIQEWQFAGRLPYRGTDVLHGIKKCLESLDNLAKLMSESSNRESLLVHMLNTSPSLDLHILEAVKLHMLAAALQIHKHNVTTTDELPLFAILMFARDTSETPQDFTKNHLQVVGDSGGLEQVEMFLLSHTLGTSIKVVRPNSFGTEDFVCCFSTDESTTNRPTIILIAEDDRHYNVLL